MDREIDASDENEEEDVGGAKDEQEVEVNNNDNVNCEGAEICEDIKPFFYDDYSDGVIDGNYEEYGLDAEWVERNGVLEERKVSPHGLNQQKRIIYTEKSIKNFIASVDFQIVSERNNDEDSWIWWHRNQNTLDGIHFGGIGGNGRGFVRSFGPESIWNEGKNREWDTNKCKDGKWCRWEVIMKKNEYTLNLYYKDVGGEIFGLKKGQISQVWDNNDYFIGLGTYHRSEVKFDNFKVNEIVFMACESCGDTNGDRICDE